MPKADLHCHALLSAPVRTYETLLDRKIPPFQGQGFDAFSDYVKRYFKPFFRNRTAFRRIIRDAFGAMAADGVTCATPGFDLPADDLSGFTLPEFVETVAEEIRRVADRIRILPELTIKRGYGPERNLMRLRQVIPYRLFAAVDLAGDERDVPCREFVPLFRYAADQGLYLKAHAGEWRGPEEIADAVHLLRVDALQHGIRAAESEPLMAVLAERRIYCNLCPGSNAELGILDDAAGQIQKLCRNEVPVTVNTDDYTVFRSPLSREMAILRTYAFTANDIRHIAENGLKEFAEIEQRQATES